MLLDASLFEDSTIMQYAASSGLTDMEVKAMARLKCMYSSKPIMIRSVVPFTVATHGSGSKDVYSEHFIRFICGSKQNPEDSVDLSRVIAIDIISRPANTTNMSIHIYTSDPRLLRRRR